MNNGNEMISLAAAPEKSLYLGLPWGTILETGYPFGSGGQVFNCPASLKVQLRILMPPYLHVVEER